MTTEHRCRGTIALATGPPGTASCVRLALVQQLQHHPTEDEEHDVDDDLHRRIEAFVAEEHELRAAHADGSGLDDDDRARLRRLEEGLDRTWDLLRQRDARRAAGKDPGEAQERSADVVEGYLN